MFDLMNNITRSFVTWSVQLYQCQICDFIPSMKIGVGYAPKLIYLIESK